MGELGPFLLACIWVAQPLAAITAAATVPDQPIFISVPPVPRLYPYAFPDVVNGPYSVVVEYTDPNGAIDLQHVYLQIRGDGPAQTIMYANLLAASQWANEGDHLYNVRASKNAIQKGYRVTYTFQIKGTWSASTNVDLEAWTLDKSELQSSHQSYDWNATYDNNVSIAGLRRPALVDNDGDGYFSSVGLEVNVDTSVPSMSMYCFIGGTAPPGRRNRYCGSLAHTR